MIWIIAVGLCIAVIPSMLAKMTYDPGPHVFNVWPGEAPGEYGDIGPERFRSEGDAPTDDARWLTDVTKPTITLYSPTRMNNTGVAMLVCPGGGYWNLAWDLEGEEIARWLNGVGITGVLLKYRVPRRPTQPIFVPAPLPLLDAQRALSLVRSKSGRWDIDPNKIGMIGFSAGGHLAISTATAFHARSYAPTDEVDTVSARPDFAIAVYPGYLAKKETGALESDVRIPVRTPPVLLIHAGDDTVSDAENSVQMYLALKRVGVSAELHVYGGGGHGFGVRKSARPVSSWTDRCIDWLRDIEIL